MSDRVRSAVESRGALSRGASYSPRGMSYRVPADVALDMWSDFPVDRTPRPLVVLGGLDIVAPLYGFRDSVLKCAYSDGAFEPPSTFPTSPPTSDG